MIIEESVILSEPFDEALAKVKAALAAVGFGVLTEIDLQATMQEKIDKSIPQHVILGACNPNLAGQALDADPTIGVLLPCNVVVREADDGVTVEALDPGLMSSLTGKEELGPVSDEARRLLGEALTQLQ
ncbi:MAG: DUF302 domain-containing protein [Candidatus Neomicrothrix subdominans]|jgi:uncharacterized protein (DUF302 family)